MSRSFPSREARSDISSKGNNVHKIEGRKGLVCSEEWGNALAGGLGVGEAIDKAGKTGRGLITETPESHGEAFELC